ncbi:MAG: four-carbon acid sugar kinase family protein [Peptostreptococcaceae bacterium]|nr:four-carbon acid sugar kinase family protein [Peptostreptococcaceae bacterium]
MIIILADDLTGANDTAIQYTQHGLKTIVMTKFDGSIKMSNFKDYQVVACNTNSRMMESSLAYIVVKEVILALSLSPNTIFYKKVDSLLRGNPGPELKAVMDVTQADIAFIAPAYPQNNRIVKNGEILSPFKPVNVAARFEETGFQSQIITYKNLEKSPELLVAAINEQFKKGIRLFLFDTLSEKDFIVISKIMALLQLKTIYCGSAGFAPYLAPVSEVNEIKPFKQILIAHEKIFVICGTRNPITQKQMHSVLSHFHADCSLLDVNDIDLNNAINRTSVDVIDKFERGDKIVFLAVSSIFTDISSLLLENEDKSNRAQTITDEIGSVVAQVCAKVNISALFVTGGDTALKVSNKLGVVGMIPLREIAPGVPLLTLVGGKADGFYMITKSGGFGDKETIVDSIEYLGGIKNKN